VDRNCSTMGGDDLVRDEEAVAKISRAGGGAVGGPTSFPLTVNPSVIFGLAQKAAPCRTNCNLAEADKQGRGGVWRCYSQTVPYVSQKMACACYLFPAGISVSDLGKTNAASAIIFRWAAFPFGTLLVLVTCTRSAADLTRGASGRL
jgi:hypothetical protein